MDMEVAGGHWRREWAGTAEFGNVTEGGVTRRVARAMEVLHASAPGTKVRVMRAAYHSTAGPGTPAASYLMHSSRRVISSGFNFMESSAITNKSFVESPSTPIKPLEISSMPLDNSNIENTSYKVTEPDDTEISEPSKWKGSTSAGSLRFPSEESSSTDNASIVDLDWKRRGSHRKSSGDSESSDFHSKRNSIDIPIRLSSPTSLSTLKFKSLLNSQQNDWNNRRKSYSFEDTSPLNETVLQSNDTLAMESSTDSGICKSTELVNDPADMRYLSKIRDPSDDIYDRDQGSFKDWLSKNRRSSYRKLNRSPLREHDSIEENTVESNISLRSLGKVTITVPIRLENDENEKKYKTTDDGERKVKRVEFCKTELHFAADSGKVNIIATDDKPPPSNDFRKRRSAFVPLNENFDKPITLFGEKNKDIFNTNNNIFFNASNNIPTENDENTAATKSILKNKIPKPKPYLLGENMAFGVSDELINKENSSTESIVPSAVLLINKQLQAGRTSMPEEDAVASNMSKIEYSHRTINDGPVKNKVSSYRSLFEREKQTEIQKNKPSVQRSPSPIKHRFKVPPLSPIPGRAHTRELRDSDLIYFGVNKENNKTVNETHTALYDLPSRDEDLFESVKLVRKISSSVCNSEAESEDTPEYINITYKTKFAPVPAPRASKLIDITEDNAVETRRSRSRRSVENSTASRSISEPPKFGRNSLERANRRRNQKNEDITVSRSKITDATKGNKEIIHEVEDTTSNGKVSPLYVNIGVKKLYNDVPNVKINKDLGKLAKPNAAIEQRRTVHKSHNKDSYMTAPNNAKKDKNYSHDMQQLPIKRTRQRTEKLVTPEHSDEKHQWQNGDVRNSIRHKRTSNTQDSVESRRKERESNKMTNTNSMTSTNKSVSKRDSKNYEEGRGKDTLRRGNKELLDRNKTSRIVDRSPSATRKIATPDNTSNDTGRRSATSRTQDKYALTKTPEGKSSKYRRSEYVINYDDKNGTVSSICKVTPPPGQLITKRHRVIEAKDKTKVSDKISLLQLPEPDWTQNQYSSHYSTHRKSKKKINIQRSCQLL